jgi:high-affinity Fe2+/Pb2+ permease
MSIGDIFYVVAIVMFSWMTFAIVRGNFQRKFNEDGKRIDLVEKEQREHEAAKKRESGS